MRVLIVKTSSMGDIIHMLPGISDAAKAIPDITFDWVTEEAFAEIPAWHKNVKRVIPIAWRRWRRDIFKAYRSNEISHFLHELRKECYDLVIDSQGLIKSAIITRLSRGIRCGLNFSSAWEAGAALAYQRRYAVDAKQHAIVRMRQLLSYVLNYSLPESAPDYGIIKARLPQSRYAMPYLVFLHATTWVTKHWPSAYWIDLAKTANHAGFTVLLPWGNAFEEQRAFQIAGQVPNAVVLPKQSLAQIAGILAHAQGIIGVDTGLSHLAAAMDIPLVSLYGPTDPALTGTMGVKQIALAAQFPCAPCLKERCTYRGASDYFPACFTRLTPRYVWETLQRLLIRS